MAGEPSWEDIFREPRQGSDAEPAQTIRGDFSSDPAPLVEPSVNPASRPAADTSFDPFGQLFSDPAPVSARGASDGMPATSVLPTAGAAAEQPLSRREAREAEARGRGSGSGRGGGSGRGSGGSGSAPRKRRRGLVWLAVLLPLVLIAGVGGTGWWAWSNYEDQIRELMGWELPNDFEGSGNGEEVIVTIKSGDIGADVATTLHAAGVTMTFDAVYDILLENPDIGFLPGNWRLQKEMSAQSAIDALQDPANKVTNELLITEGSVLPDVLEIIASTTGLSLEDVQAAAANPQAYGVPAQAPSLEGYLFPATYQLDGGETAEQIIQLLVDTMFEHLDAFGVAPELRHETLTMASIIQREAGSNIDDFYKVSRVFQNRIEQGINLESDATVAYGTGNLHTVWTTDAERADASNPYNTYANPGLPVGPIGMPGDDAISAALNPADGPWLFFVPINLATGETVFSETVDEHEAAVEILREWCNASPENATYCE